MTSEDAKAFGKIMVVLSMQYDKAVSPDLTELYFSNLSKYPLSEIDRAAKLLINSCEFFPKLVDFHRILKSADETIASDMFLKAKEIVQRFGRPTAAQLAGYHPLIPVVVTATWGGWTAFGNSEESQLKYDRRRFEEICKNYLERGGNDPATLRQITGGNETGLRLITE